MLYTEDFCMHYYAGFSQIGSHIQTVNSNDINSLQMTDVL